MRPPSETCRGRTIKGTIDGWCTVSPCRVLDQSIPVGSLGSYPPIRVRVEYYPNIVFLEGGIAVTTDPDNRGSEGVKPRKALEDAVAALRESEERYALAL